MQADRTSATADSPDAGSREVMATALRPRSDRWASRSRIFEAYNKVERSITREHLSQKDGGHSRSHRGLADFYRPPKCSGPPPDHRAIELGNPSAMA